MTPDSPLALLVVPAAGAFALDAAVRARVILTNDGENPLLVNRRMLVNDPTAPADVREVVIDIAGPPGYVELVEVFVNARAPGAEDFADLGPGESLEREVELTRYHSLHLPGTYRLRATYANAVDPPGLPRPAWIGSVSSPWVSFERAPAA